MMIAMDEKLMCLLGGSVNNNIIFTLSEKLKK